MCVVFSSALSLSQICPVRVRLYRQTCLSTPVICFTGRSKSVIFLLMIFVSYVSSLSFYAVLSVSCSVVVTCWERADQFAVVCAVFSSVLSLSQILS